MRKELVLFFIQLEKPNYLGVLTTHYFSQLDVDNLRKRKLNLRHKWTLQLLQFTSFFTTGIGIKK